MCVSVEMLRKVREIQNHPLCDGQSSFSYNHRMQKKLRIPKHLFFSPYEDGSRREAISRIDIGLV